MALAEPLFTSQLYRENANVDTYTRLYSLTPFPIRTLRFFRAPFRQTVLSICTWLPALFHPLPEMSSINFSRWDTAWLATITFFRFVFAADQFDRQQIYRFQEYSFLCFTSGTDHWNSHDWNPRRVFEFRFHKGCERNSLCHILHVKVM